MCLRKRCSWRGRQWRSDEAVASSIVLVLILVLGFAGFFEDENENEEEDELIQATATGTGAASGCAFTPNASFSQRHAARKPASRTPARP